MPVLHEAQARNPAVSFVFINKGESAQRVGGWLAARDLSLRNVLLDTKGQALSAFTQCVQSAGTSNNAVRRE